ncbi:MAG: hypothetical protein ACOC5A_04510, partial [Halanaerobiales bacterium]
VNPEVVARDVRFLDWPDDSEGGGGYQKSGNYNQAPQNNQQSQQSQQSQQNQQGQQNQGGPDEDIDDEFDVPF